MGTVALIHSPHTVRLPPHALITAWVIFWLFFFTLFAWVPQKPGVRQIAALGAHDGSRFASALHCPSAGSQQTSGRFSAEQETVEASWTQFPVASQAGIVQPLLSVSVHDVPAASTECFA